MTTTRVDVRFEVRLPLSDGETLCYQNCQYNYPDGRSDIRNRFIRRDEKGNLKAQRGQAGADGQDFKTLLNAMDALLELPAHTFMSKQSWTVEELHNRRVSI